MARSLLRKRCWPNLFPANELAPAAAAFNDLGEHQRAADILREATAKIPGPKRKLGVDVTLGPIVDSTLGAGDGIRSHVAVELYAPAIEQRLRNSCTIYHLVSSTWSDLYGVFRRHGQDQPSNQEVIEQLPPDSKLGLFNDLATEAPSNGQFEDAKQLLQRLVMEAKQHEPAVSSPLWLKLRWLALSGHNPRVFQPFIRSGSRAPNVSS
jgi:hypothetical protein